VVMHEDDRRRRKFEGAAHHLAGIDRRMIDGAAALDLVGDQGIALVEEEDADVFLAVNFRSVNSLIAGHVP